MAYTPTTWAKGDVVTSEKLNKLEGGTSAATTLVVNAETDSQTSVTALDQTAGDIFAAAQAGGVVVKTVTGEDLADVAALLLASVTADGYQFVVMGSSENATFYAATADDYPTDEAPASGGGDS